MPAPQTQFDPELLLRLPLPLAQLVRRAHNAPDARARHNNAFYLFEATIKLTASVLVAGYARCLQNGEPRNNSLDRPLGELARPTLGHWVAIVRELSRHFGRRPDAASHPLGHLAAKLQEPRREYPAMLELYRRITNGPDSEPSKVQSCSLLELFDKLVAYRNTVIGHGADRCDEFYEHTMGPLLLPAAADILAEGHFNLLGPPGSRLVYLGEVRKLDDDRFEIGLRELLGAGSMRVEPLRLSSAEQAAISPNRLAVLWPGHSIPLRLDPLLIYRETELNEEVRFLNSDRDGKEVEYLSYTAGKPDRDQTTVADLARLLELVAGHAPQRGARAMAAVPPPVERDFEILAEIGRGGMGIIYLARQISLGRLVALKMLPAELSGDEVALARFNREIRALGQCDDPRIVKVLTSGKMPDGQRYYAMEYVPGADLDTVWHELTGSLRDGSTANLDGTTWSRAVLTACRHKRTETLQRASSLTSTGGAAATTAGISAATAAPATPAAIPRIQSPEAAELLSHLAPLPELLAVDESSADYNRRVATLIRDAARALQTVHDLGMVHRDVKPANLMLTADGGRVVLMDFGLAKGHTRTLEASRSTGLLGTLRYAAPEQLAAAQLKVGPKADVRGLGVTLFELLTRHRLFEQAVDEKQLTLWILTKPVPKLRRIDPSLDADLEAIVAAATEPSQDDRLTARQLADLLDLYLAGKPLPIRLPSLKEMLRRWIRDNRGTFAAATAAAAILLTGVAIAFALVNAAKNDAESAKENATNLAGDNAKLAQRERNAHEQTETQLYYSNIALAGAKWRDCRVDQTLQILDQCRPDRRDWEWNHLRRSCRAGFDVEHVAGISGNDKVLAVSPDGDLVAVSDGKTIRLLHRRGGGADPKSATKLPGGAGNIINLVFSPDGEHLAAAAEVSNAEEKKTGEIKVWHMPDGKELTKIATHTVPLGLGSPVFSPDGHDLIVADENQAYIYNLKDHRIRSMPGRPVLAVSVALSPDRKTLAVGGAKRGENGYEGGVVHLWNPETGANDKTLMVSATFVQHLVFSDDSKYLAVAGFDNAVSVWDVQTGNELGRHADHTKRVIGMVFLDDLIVSAAEDKTLRIWQWKTSKGVLATTETTPLRMPTSAVDIVRSKKGGPLFTIDKEGTVSTWKGVRQDYTLCQRHNRPISTLAFNADGSLVASRGFGGQLKVYDWKSRKEVFSLDDEDAIELSAAFSPDGRWLAINVEADKKEPAIVIYDAQAWKEAFRFSTGKSKLRQLAFSPDGKRLAAIGFEFRTMIVWDLGAAGGKQSAQMHPARGDVFTALAFSSDGAKLATVCKDSIKIWHSQSGELARILPRGTAAFCQDIAFSSDEKLVACVVEEKDGEPRLKVYDALSGEPAAAWDGHIFNFISGAVNPKGTRLVTYTVDDGARIVETKSGRELTAFPKWGTTRAALFSPDGRFVAAAANSEDLLGPGSVRLFDGSPPKDNGGISQ